MTTWIINSMPMMWTIKEHKFTTPLDDSSLILWRLNWGKPQEKFLFLVDSPLRPLPPPPPLGLVVKGTVKKKQKKTKNLYPLPPPLSELSTKKKNFLRLPLPIRFRCFGRRRRGRSPSRSARSRCTSCSQISVISHEKT